MLRIYLTQGDLILMVKTYQSVEIPYKKKTGWLGRGMKLANYGQWFSFIFTNASFD